MIRVRYKGSALLLLLASDSSLAHSFGQSYTLPVPVWMYLYGAAAALIVSFVLVGYFASGSGSAFPRREVDLVEGLKPCRKWTQFMLAGLRILSVLLLMTTILSGFVGSRNPYHNLNMTLFWVIFVLGLTYLTAVIGDWYALLSPFRALTDWVASLFSTKFQGVFVYPMALSYWPGLLLYMVFIWLELFGRATPLSLSWILTGYTFLNLIGCWLIGQHAWFKYCEFFSVFLCLVAKLAPLNCVYSDVGKLETVRLRLPFSGLLQTRRVPLSLLVFVLFMLSSTAFDGLHETALWVGAFWKNLYQLILFPLYGAAPPVTLPTIRALFLTYQSLALILSPLVYFGLYAFSLCLARRLVRSPFSLRELLSWFAYSLIPIVFAYHFTHYYTLLQSQGPQMITLISDPFDMGWNLFGSRDWDINVVPDMGVVWHTQVLVIVVGHIVSVYLAHVQALALFPDRRAAIISQLPVLALMVVFTSLGLWILSLPLNPAGPGG